MIWFSKCSLFFCKGDEDIAASSIEALIEPSTMGMKWVDLLLVQ